METLIIITLLTILSQTTYLAYKQLFSGKLGHDSVLLDTSVLIDGRIEAIARSGLISAKLVVPRSVVRELQFMADRADHDKRERARFGLDIIEKLREIPDVDLEVKDDGITSQHGVDEQLIVLAREHGAKLCTVDYNLNKAARVQSVTVININELAHALRTLHLPGESVEVELIQPGQDKKQGVGYLDDGTMVVVDDSRDYIGKTVSVELTRVLQTAAGRMMFARRTGPKSTGSRNNQKAQVPAPTSQYKRNRNGRDTKPTDQPSQPTSSAKTTTKQTVRTQPRKSGGAKTPVRAYHARRPRSAEDKLVNLANK